jgi:uncharacterized SAM-binding protein YcdF (DUF218 family)
MEFMFVKAVTPWILPPGVNFLVLVMGALCMRRWRRIGAVLIGCSLFTLYAMSTHDGASFLRSGLNTYQSPVPHELRDDGVEAIVIMGGGRYRVGPEFGGETVSAATSTRLRYGAYLHRLSGLPILVTGGSVYGESNSEAQLMKLAAARDFRVEVKWVEGQAQNSAENALRSATILAREGVKKIALVTHDVHMGRSVWAFERAGLLVVPAPTILDAPGDGSYGYLSTVFPSARALAVSSDVLHEYFGTLWYSLRY